MPRHAAADTDENHRILYFRLLYGKLVFRAYLNGAAVVPDLMLSGGSRLKESPYPEMENDWTLGTSL